jgi:hypothetical protein
MPETATVGPTAAKEAATVSASVLAQHLDCSRAYIGKLEAEGVIERVTASRSTRAASPTCDTCGASGGNHRAVRLMPITSGSRPRSTVNGEEAALEARLVEETNLELRRILDEVLDVRARRARQCDFSRFAFAMAPLSFIP